MRTIFLCVTAIGVFGCGGSVVAPSSPVADLVEDGGLADFSVVPSGPCAGITCDSPPQNYCVDQTTLRAYVHSGTCASGLCGYQHTDVSCGSGCQNGACVGNDPCDSITCNSPPGPSCANANILERYSPSGTCSGGTCTYASTTSTCANGCSAGACDGDPCAGVSCNQPPAPYCADATMRRSFANNGTCGNGTCSYAPVDTSCTHGCTAGACNSDPCAGITCDNPPVAVCVANSTYRRSYSLPGTCKSGVCTYSATDTFCAAGCAFGICNTDPCAGVICSTPPATSCANASTKRSYSSNGTCGGGSCSYVSTDTLCPAPAAETAMCTSGVCDFTCNTGYVRSGSSCISSAGHDTWTTVASLPAGRASLSAVAANGLVYALGGSDPNIGSTNFVYTLSPGANSWSAAHYMISRRLGAAAVLGADGRIYAIGGSGPA